MPIPRAMTTTPHANRTLTAVSLFAGCGGSDLGMQAAGIKTIWANEIHEPACQLYERVVGNGAMRCGDIRLVEEFPKADILAGCYPCQGYSNGGRRKTSDKINYLYREFDRALRQIRPKAFIVENVDGMRRLPNQPLFNNQIYRFRMAGYRVSHQILNAKDYGLAQDRKRVIIVGIRTDLDKRFVFPKPTHGPDSDSKQPHRTLKDVIWGLRDKAPEGSFCEEDFHWYYMSRNRRRNWDQQSPCVVAHWRHAGLHPDSPPLIKLGEDQWMFDGNPNLARRYTYLECAALQGFPNPDHFKGVPTRELFRAIGNAVPPPLFESVSIALKSQLRSN